MAGRQRPGRRHPMRGPGGRPDPGPMTAVFPARLEGLGAAAPDIEPVAGATMGHVLGTSLVGATVRAGAGDVHRPLAAVAGRTRSRQRRLRPAGVGGLSGVDRGPERTRGSGWRVSADAGPRREAGAVRADAGRGGRPFRWRHVRRPPRPTGPVGAMRGVPGALIALTTLRVWVPLSLTSGGRACA
jgi:hypothetical protein